MLPATSGEVNGENHPSGRARPLDAEGPFGETAPQTDKHGERWTSSFRPILIHPQNWTYLKQKKKELSTKGHEERRRAAKALRLTATGCQGCEGMVDFRLFCPCMIRPGGRGPNLSETIEGYPQRPKKRNPRRATKDDEGPLRGWRKLKRDPPKVGRGEEISTKGAKVMNPRRDPKGLGFHEGH